MNDTLKLDSKLFGSCAVYVMQDDMIFHAFTVKEALTFAARLKLDLSIEQQDKRIEELIKKLGLEKC